ECAHEDEQIDIAIQTVKSICKKTNRQAGDGTTTAIVLGEAIFKETLKALRDSEGTLNPQLVKVEIENLVEEVIQELKERAVSVGNNLDIIESVATISANGANDIGSIIRQ